MSVDIVGSTRLVAGLDPDDAQVLLDTAFAQIQTAIADWAGSIVAFTGDGALAVFGWPEANEQHADNACRAALAIQAATPDAAAGGQQVLLRIGISSGLVVVRKVEMGLVSRYDIIGDAAHRAAALQKRAPTGQTLVCESTQGLLHHSRLANPTELDLGLRTGPVRASLLEKAHSGSSNEAMRQRHRLPLLGRDHETLQVRQLLQDDCRQPAMLACIGDPGIGKSRLAALACEAGVECGRRIILHECRDLDSTAPFAGVRAVISTILGGDSPVSDAEVAAAFARAGGLQEDYSATLAIFSRQSGSEAGTLAAPASQTRVARALAQTLARGALTGPTLLVIEDVHNLDPESWQVFSFLAGEAPACPLAIFLTGRPEAHGAAAAVTPDVMALAPLTDGAIAGLVALVGGALEPSVQAEIVSRTDGNPFMMTQFLEQPDILGQGGDRAVLPRSVEALIHARLDRLGPEARRLAQSLSLLGETVDVELAGAAAGEQARVGSAPMEELERLAFIHRPSAGEIRFRHALITAACASSIVRSRRRVVHEAALSALSKRKDVLPDLYPRLAHHAEQAGHDDQAIEFHWEAARRARSLGASQSLMATFERARACCERLGAAGDRRFVDLVLLVFETFHLQGEIGRIEPQLLRAAEFARAQGRTDKQCIAQCHLGIASWYRGRFADGERIMRPAYEQAMALGHLPLRFAAQFILAQQLHNLARISEALALVDELCGLLKDDLELARLGAMGLPSSIANSHAGYYLLEAGRYEEAERYIRKGMSIAERGGDAYSESLARIALGRLFLLTQRNQEAVDCLARGAAIIERQGYDPALLNVTGLLATGLARTGQAQEAVALAQARLQGGLLARTGSYERHYFWCGYGEALLFAGRIDEGLSRIEEAVQVGRETDNPCILVQSLSLRAAALRFAGADTTEADAAAALARELEARYDLVAPRGFFNQG